jgi:hypothetical protein
MKMYQKHQRKIKWAIVALIAVGGALGMLEMDMVGFAQAWAGKIFKALSGALLGWFISRYVADLDLSNIEPNLRPIAGLSQAILIAGGMIAVASI